MPWPLDVARFRALMGAEAPASEDTAALTGAIDAAVAFVEQKRADLYDTTVTPAVFRETPTVELGTAMLANRWYQRRQSPLGIAGYTEFGQPGILRHDPDIARMLGLGTEGPFVFGAAGWHPPEESTG